MPNRHMKYVLVGAGAASASAAAAIRSLDPAGPLLLVGQEINRPYHRPHLSRDYLLGRRRHEDLFTHDPAWFGEHHVDLRTHRRVAQLDCARRTVSLDDGQEISFDTLLLATGAAPRRLPVPGADLPNVFYLRTVEDADRLRHAIDSAHKQHLPSTPTPLAGTQPVPGRPPRVAVIGTGLLGLELASTLTQLGLHVDLFSKDPHPYYKYAGDLPGKSVARYVESRGVTFHPNSPVASLQGDGRAQRVVTTTGQSTPCDLVVVAIGIVPHKELLRGTPIAAERAILTDAAGQTNVPGIFAAGDCAARFDPLFGKHRLTDHWDSAVDTGAIAGAAMAGGPPPSEPLVTSFTTTTFDLTLHSFGEPRLAARRLARTTPTPPDAPPLFTEFAVDAANRLTQLLTTDPSLDPATCRALIAARLPINGHEESLKDPSIPLTRFLPE